MNAKMLAFRKLYKIVKESNYQDITQISLLFSTLAYFSNDFIYKITKELSIEDLSIIEINGLKAIYLTYKDNRFVAFRGTEFSLWSNTKRVLNFIPKKNHLNRKVHRGFLMAFTDLKREIDKLIFKPKSVIFTGHSLGGALAILSAEMYDGAAITFASPKVYFNEKVNNKIYHVGHSIQGDPVPLLPPTTFFLKWCRPKPQFVWRYKKYFINILKYHHLNVYIEHLLEIINERNKN